MNKDCYLINTNKTFISPSTIPEKAGAISSIADLHPGTVKVFSPAVRNNRMIAIWVLHPAYPIQL